MRSLTLGSLRRAPTGGGRGALGARSDRPAEWRTCGCGAGAAAGSAGHDLYDQPGATDGGLVDRELPDRPASPRGPGRHRTPERLFTGRSATRRLRRGRPRPGDPLLAVVREV